MYRIDRTANRICKLPAARFADFQFTERNHLQEWIAHQPDALGEDLLIIQKEFAGFDDTKERLDLLALDKQGGLVVIENKLDDSGRDVVWQSLKYASYCSTLSRTHVASIYQQYLDRQGIEAKAEDRICEFLDEEDFGEVILNPGNDQRMILVAAQFRKEVTSTVLWLLKHDVRIQCFKATPFQDGDALFLNLEQVIPLAEAEELMIGIAEKEKEEHITEKGLADRISLRTDFWHQVLEALRIAGVDVYANVSPSRDPWLNAGSGVSGVHYTMIFGRNEVRVEFSFSRPARDENKALFDALESRKEEIEARFGGPLEWRRVDERKISMVRVRKPCDGHDRESWPQICDWFVDQVRRMATTFGPEIGAMRQRLGQTAS
jgi:hypothetical protein